MIAVPLILAGGRGERFWPLSRSSNPKQLLRLAGNKTMVEETLARARAACGGAQPLVITGRQCAAAMRRALGRRVAYDCIVEPVGKNTAPAIALGALWVRRRHGDAVMLVASADHAIAPKQAFVKAVRSAAFLAQKTGSLVVFGIRPTRPDTGYGYINIGKPISGAGGTASYQVRRFVEKPSAAVAREYVRSGNYLWNSGMFVWKTSAILSEIKEHMPRLYRQACAVERAGFTKASIDRYYKTCESESIDYGIMEKSSRIAAVCGAFCWDDIGSWEAMTRVHPKNKKGTVAVGPAVFDHESSNSIIYNASPLHVASIGLDNAVLVVTPDAVLAVARPLLPGLKKYLGMMKEKKFPAKLF
ncbi:MAG TPA: mannose-1-phosphate guanylyltransferase [Chitinivibrionales bacterium]|nr:mannose-1-phosphate guanylyltransferase [Chitinivibrionales bacterium]